MPVFLQIMMDACTIRRARTHFQTVNDPSESWNALLVVAGGFWVA
jgi:hypothetical protein